MYMCTCLTLRRVLAARGYDPPKTRRGNKRKQNRSHRTLPPHERQVVHALPPRLPRRHGPKLREAPDRRPWRAPQVLVQRLEERGPLQGVSQVGFVEGEEAAGGLAADGVDGRGAVRGALLRVPPLQRLLGLLGGDGRKVKDDSETLPSTRFFAVSTTWLVSGTSRREERHADECKVRQDGADAPREREHECAR